MKSISLLLIVLLISSRFALSCSAQANEWGVIKYEANFISKSPDARYPFRGATCTIIFNDTKYREDDREGLGLKRTTIYNGGDPFSLIEGNGDGRKIKTIYKKPYRGVYTGTYEMDSTYTVEYTTDSMTIASYRCVKIIIETNKGRKFIAYITDAVPANINWFNLFPYKKVKGFPLQFEIVKDGNKIFYKATSVDLTTPVPDSDFIVDDKGFNVIPGYR